MNFETENIPGPGHGQESNNTKGELLNLAQELGFIETKDLLDIKQTFVYDEGLIANSSVFNIWRDEAESALESITDTTVYAKAQIGLIINLATVYKDFGEIEEYTEAINDAIDYAYELGLDDIVTKLQSLSE